MKTLGRKIKTNPESRRVEKTADWDSVNWDGFKLMGLYE